MNPLTPHVAMDRLMVFAGNANPHLAQEVAKHLNMSLGRAIVGKFSDGEVMVEIMENVRGKDVFVLQSTCQPTKSRDSSTCRWTTSMPRRCCWATSGSSATTT